MEDASTSSDWEEFQTKLMDAKSSYKGKEGKGPRYAVYDFQYELEGGEGTRYVPFSRLGTYQGGICQGELSWVDES